MGIANRQVFKEQDIEDTERHKHDEEQGQECGDIDREQLLW